MCLTTTKESFEKAFLSKGKKLYAVKSYVDKTGCTVEFAKTQLEIS